MSEGLTIEQIRNALRYDPDTGLLSWRVSRGSCAAGDCVGTVKVDGPRRYVNVQLYGKMYKAHRLVWFLAYGRWPEGVIDHINGNGIDNRLANLRDATPSQNSANDRLRKPGKHPKGVSFDARSKRYLAKGCLNRKWIHLGSFRTADEAAQAYRTWRVAVHGEFAHV
jgi:hypothetical protein